MKRLIAFLLTFIMSISLLAGVTLADDRPVLTIGDIDPDRDYDNQRIWRLVEDRLGCKIQFIPLPTDTYAAVLASGDLPDIVHPNNNLSAILEADLSAYLALQMNCLSDIARKLNEPEAAEYWKQKSAALIDKMIARLWNGTRFVPRLCRTQEEIGDTESILLYLPLVLGNLLPAEIADKMIEEMKKHHLTACGLASESPESPKYNPDGYWRGPIWAPTTYLIVDGLKRMGRVEDAREIALRFCGMCTEKAHGFYENYDALTGIGLRTPGYTWTASAFLCMVWEFCS